MAYMDYMDPDVLCPQKADNPNLSLSSNPNFDDNHCFWSYGMGE